MIVVNSTSSPTARLSSCPPRYPCKVFSKSGNTSSFKNRSNASASFGLVYPRQTLAIPFIACTLTDDTYTFICKCFFVLPYFVIVPVIRKRRESCFRLWCRSGVFSHFFKGLAEPVERCTSDDEYSGITMLGGSHHCIAMSSSFDFGTTPAEGLVGNVRAGTLLNTAPRNQTHLQQTDEGVTCPKKTRVACASRVKIQWRR